jgi:hypothetical protein
LPERLFAHIRSAKLEQLYGHWLSLRFGAPIPLRASLDPMAVAPLLPWVFLIELEQASNRFRYRLAGTEIVRVHGAELRGRFLDELLPASYYREVEPVFRQVAVDGRSMLYSGRMATAGTGHLAYERLLLPLARPGESNVVLGITDYRFAKELDRPFKVGEERLIEDTLAFDNLSGALSSGSE